MTLSLYPWGKPLILTDRRLGLSQSQFTRTGSDLISGAQPILKVFMFPHSDSWVMDVTVGYDFLGLCDARSSYKRVSGFERLRSYGCLKPRINGNVY